MKAYMVVGPTNFQPSFFRSFDRAVASADVDAVCGGASGAGSGA